MVNRWVQGPLKLKAGAADGIQRRVFLVGCLRSGTTLLQSLLAAHEQIASFPESHFFERFPRWGWRLRLGIVSRQHRERAQLFRFLADAGHSELEGLVPRHAIFSAQYVAAFVRILDTLTLSRSRSIWVEKTPGHLRAIDVIQRHIRDARFIHILRNGPDVVASLYEVKKAYPELWGGPADLDGCILRWNRDVGLTRQYVGLPHHTVVRYERLVDHPAAVLDDACRFIGVGYRPDMLAGLGSGAQAVVLGTEPWKRGVLTGQVSGASVGKFERVFDEEQRRYILDRLVDHSL